MQGQEQLGPASAYERAHACDEPMDAGARRRDRYVGALIEAGSSLALPELRRRYLLEAVYRVSDRGGVGVVAIPEVALDERQRDALARFRFAQYLAAGYADADVTFRERLDRDTLAGYTSADTVHFIAFAAGTGELLACMSMVGPPPAPAGTRVGSRSRPLLPVEEQFGWGPFNRLALVSDTPLERVRDLGRMVKNQRHGGSGPRAFVELCVAVLRLLSGPLAPGIEVCVGQLDPSRVQRNLEFFHIPLVVLRGGLPVLAPGDPLNLGLEGRDRYPFAFAVADLPPIAARLDAVEAALALPDAQALAALADLRRTGYESSSSLVPQDGIPALADTPLPQCSTSTAERRRARELGARLSRIPAFAGLSDTERTTLRRFAVETQVAPGATILECGEVARELVLIEDGQAEGHIRGRLVASAIGPGACLGASGVLTGAASPLTVVASTPMRALRLPVDVYWSHLRELPDVELELQRLAADALPMPAPARPSLIGANTAETQAALRAAGAAERDPLLRNPDSMAAGFVTAQLRLQTLAKVPGVRRLVPVLAERLAPGAYYYETARVKHVDAILAAELREGLAQVVIVGAGYDSRAYRFAGALRDVRVFEIDLPSMSESKRRKVARVYPGPPAHVTYIGADLLGPDIEGCLNQHAYDIRGATLLILSGVSPYLPEWAVARLFRFTARHTSPRSSIVFDYMFREMVDGDDSARGARQVRKRLDACGEPARFGIPAGCAAQFVGRFGLRLVSDLQPDDLADRYLRRADGTSGGRPYGFSAIAHARVSE